MKTIIITGANGFIGSNLVNLLNKKYKLILLIRLKKIFKRTSAILIKIFHINILKIIIN